MSASSETCRSMPPNAQLRVLNPMVNAALQTKSASTLPTQAGVLARLPGSAMNGGVSSFGYSGTIVHAVVSRDSTVSATRATGLSVPVYKRKQFAWYDAPHPFIQRRLSEGGEDFFRTVAAGTLQSLVADHVVQSRIIFPGAGHLEVARAACCAVTRSAAAMLNGVFFLMPLVVDQLGLYVECEVSSGQFEVRSGELEADGSLSDPVTHCTGGAVGAARNTRVWNEHAMARASRAGHAADVKVLYDGFHSVGLQYGPSFRGVAQAWNADGAAAAVLVP